MVRYLTQVRLGTQYSELEILISLIKLKFSETRVWPNVFHTLTFESPKQFPRNGHFCCPDEEIMVQNSICAGV